MSEYNPPVNDMMFVLNEVCGLDELPEHPDYGDINTETVEMIFDPAAKLASKVIAPLNWDGDQVGAKLENGVVTTAPGFKEAYAEYRDGGWNAVPFTSDYGGQALPWLIAFPLQEMWQGANMSFGLCPLLNQGAIDAIEHHGSDEQKNYYLEKLISGEWTGTMNLTEPQAGSDLSQIRTKAEPQSDGTYKIAGQKIFITYGEHDMADNIIHLVLARLPDAPEGVKGISLFIVPKVLEDGTRNDAKCTGIEHKLGIHASPTCTMQFGDEGGAIGYLVGEANMGLKYMFTMMNNARLSVGLQGVAISERAYQHALSYANERQQGGSLIVEHADVRRNLLSMKAQTEAARALTYSAARYLDLARTGDEVAQARVDLLTPIVKGWATDMAVEVSSTGVQIHGGMGFVEETGAAQYMRDSRILPIYEGTNGIQANDLVFRKVARDDGQAAFDLIAEWKDKCVNPYLRQSLDSLKELTQELVGNKDDREYLSAAASPYLRAWGVIAGGVMMDVSAQKAQERLSEGDEAFLNSKILTAEFYMSNILPRAEASFYEAKQGGRDLSEIRFGKDGCLVKGGPKI